MWMFMFTSPKRPKMVSNVQSLLQWTCLVVLFVHISGAPLDCAQPVDGEIHQCMTPVKRYAEVLTNSTKRAQKDRTLSGFGGGLALPSNLGREVFRELCGLIRRFDQCVKKARTTCPTHLTLRLMDASYGYLCNAGYETFLANADCLMELDQRPEAKECHDKTMFSIQELNEQHTMSITTKMDRMCKSLNFFARCVRTPIQTQCNTESWQVIYRVLRDTTHVVMPQCRFEPQYSSASSEGGGNRYYGQYNTQYQGGGNAINNDSPQSPRSTNTQRSREYNSGVDQNAIHGQNSKTPFPDPTLAARAASSTAEQTSAVRWSTLTICTVVTALIYSIRLCK